MTLPRITSVVVLAIGLLMSVRTAMAQSSEPAASYIFPAGARQGDSVQVTVGGLFLLNDPWLDMSAPGISATSRLSTIDTLRLEGPQLTGQPSLEPDEYPQDHRGTVTVDARCRTGVHPWRVWTSQGATESRMFVVGDLPEVVEEEFTGDPLPADVEIPVTINGRIHPRTDLDVWTFDAVQGTTYAVELCARAIDSPLDARIALYTNGTRVADDIGTRSSDPVIQFTAQQSGKYQVHVHDVGHAGGQAFVYRLTIREGLHARWVYPLGGQRGTSVECETGFGSLQEAAGTESLLIPLPKDRRLGDVFATSLTVGDQSTQSVCLQVSDLPEQVEEEPNDAPSTPNPIATPVMVNGRIQQSGDSDLWPIAVVAGQPLELRLSAPSLGSPLRPLVDVVDSNGDIVIGSESPAMQHNTPSADIALSMVPETDAIWWIRIRDHFPGRGGPGFGYRMQIGAAGPGFHLQLQKDAITLARGGEVSLPLRLERYGGLTGPVSLEITGLPPETEPAERLIPADQNEFQLKLSASETAPVGGHRLRIHGTLDHEGIPIRQPARRRLSHGDAEIDTVLLGIAMPTPFQFRNRGPYYARVHAGTVYRHPFSVERNGFEGPILVRIADRQRRHLQGARGHGVCVVPAGETDFEFPFFLPPGMSRDRLGRCLVMGVAEVTDEQGRSHQVAFTDGEQSQAPINVKAPRLNVACRQTSVYVPVGTAVDIGFRIQRGEQLQLPATVQLIVPDHIQGVRNRPVSVEADDDSGVLAVHLEDGAGPFNCPLTVQATIIEDGDPVVAETQIELVTDE